MKYIKTFEKLLKHTDEYVLEHKFRAFAEKLKSLLILLKKCDDLKYSTVRIYYDSYGEIKIIYNYKYIDLYTFRLITYDRPTGLELCIISNYRKFGKDLISVNDTLHEIFDNIVKKYENERSFYYPNSHDIPITDINNLSILDKIYDEVSDEFEYIVAANKYNL
jgi:hypothetical protein